MEYSSIRSRIAVSYILLIFVAMGSFAIYLSRSMRETYLDNLETHLLTEAALLQDTLAPAFTKPDPGELNRLAQHYADIMGARITFIAPDGTVLGESEYDYTQMENHLYRPEVQLALQNGHGSSLRYSKTASEETLYVAQSTGTEEGLEGIIRVALSIGDINASLSRLNFALLIVTAIMTLLAVGIAVGIAHRTTHSIRDLVAVVQQITAGDLSARLLPTSHDEIGQLSNAFNIMAEELQEKITALSTEQSRISAVMERMADGVVITNRLGQVELINPAATHILGIGHNEAIGHSFAEVARHHQLIELWQSCQRSNKEQTATIETSKREGRFLQIIITPLDDPTQKNILVVFQDLTRIRRLETVRRDFISNISHELRTPLASVKLLVETLEDGAINDPTASKRFLGHMEQEVTTMAQLVEELLELSRIESGKVPLHLQPTPVALLLAPPIERLSAQAEHNGLTLKLEMPMNLPKVLADGERMQRVISNLVHNAIKFTPSGGSITVSAEAKTNRVIIAVRDTGVGIPDDDIPRIFERFYKTDRARSGGGTGLGLAIAKHIVQAHGGRIWVESHEGHGSIFYFTIPVAQNLKIWGNKKIP